MASKDEETGLRPLASVAGALVVWLICATVSGRVLRSHPDSMLVRGSMVALAAGSFAAWLAAVARLILSQDEFSQRILLVAVALASAATAVLLVAGGLLQSAGLLGEVPLMAVLLVMGVLWWFGILIATRYYR